jgi:hypothetical protein
VLTWPDYAVLTGSLIVLLVLSEMKVLAFGWSWLVVLGTVGTILLALTFSATARRDSSRPS